MKKLLSILLLFACVNSVKSQIADPTSMTLGTLIRNFIFPIETYTEIKGTPYFLDSSFNSSVIYLKDGKRYSCDKMRIDLFANKIHFLDNNKVELVVDDNVVERVVFFRQGVDTIAGFGFSCNYPVIGKNTAQTYYLEENYGKARVLVYLSKEVTYSKMVTGLFPEKYFLEKKEYFIYNENRLRMERLRKNKEFVLDILRDKQTEVSKFISDNNLKCKSVADIIKVFEYYNTLK
ncbi:MAG: hypothetical protein HYR66_11250 [Sphingobacteriales bacterium]|nr:hypothetical protein [Sphingobacteriales bacterium]MBI3717924.1 hypothetical protein [Sphingobacteriales bacterium]